MTKTGLPPRKYSATRETPAVTNSGIETEALNFNPETSTNSARSQASKPPSSSRTKNSRPSFSPASKTTTNQSSALLKGAKQSPNSSTPNKTDIKSPSERVSASTRQRKSPGVRTVSSTSSAAQSRTLTSSSRTNSSGSINTLTSQNKDPGSDAASDDEQDIRFFDVQSQSLQSSRASSKLSSRSARGSATQRKQDGGGKKPYKTINPEEIVSLPYSHDTCADPEWGG